MRFATPSPADVINFWFSADARPNWFAKSEAFDEAMRARFEEAYALARDGALEDWRDMPASALALIILLDQVPRNIYRGTAQAFATDDKALAIAEHAIACGFDAHLGEEERVFLYMPFMHAESIAAQEKGVALFEALGRAENLDYMRRHRDVIARFGRFPHRNAVLGRVSTPDEIDFLKLPGSSF
jgi:uncharacterized protein (DUF924 family)